MMYRCCDELRRNEVATHPPLNGIDYLEVVDRDLSETDPLRQRTLLVSCLRPVPAGLSRDNVRIFGGDRRQNITVEWAMPAATVLAAPDTLQEHGTRGVIDDAADLSLVLVVRVAETGDYSTYTLQPRDVADRRHPAAELRSAAFVRSSSRSRSIVRPTSTACRPISVRGRTGVRARHQLSRQGLCHRSAA